jgi:hypothetical protein
MNQINMNSQDKINLMNNKETPWELNPSHHVQVIANYTRSMKWKVTFLCEMWNKTGNFLDCPTFNTWTLLTSIASIMMIQLQVFCESLQWWILWCPKLRKKNLQQILSSPFSFDLHEMLCFKFSDICNKAGRRIDEKQPVKCSKFDFWFLKHWSTISQCSKG